MIWTGSITVPLSSRPSIDPPGKTDFSGLEGYRKLLLF